MKEKLLLQLAQIASPEIKTLEVQNSDRLDFHEVSITNLTKALQTAYNLGQARGQEPSLDTLNK